MKHMEQVATGSSFRTTKYAEHGDDFPTPPWATRALLKHVIPDIPIKGYRVLEPAAGRGHMVKVLREQGARVAAYDINPVFSTWGTRTKDYLNSGKFPTSQFVITNPPYAQADTFVLRAIKEAEIGVGMLIQTLFLKGVRRFDTLLKHRPPERVGFFTKFIPATRGKVVQKQSVFMSHSWFWWNVNKLTLPGETRLILIPPTAQVELERAEDYLTDK